MAAKKWSYQLMNGILGILGFRFQHLKKRFLDLFHVSTIFEIHPYPSIHPLLYMREKGFTANRWSLRVNSNLFFVHRLSSIQKDEF